LSEPNLPKLGPQSGPTSAFLHSKQKMKSRVEPMTIENNHNRLFDAALEYSGKGWKVLPLHTFDDGACTCESKNCTSPAKHPLTAKGVHDASVDESIINRWWTEADVANVGVATGNGLLVLDIDAKNAGLESLAHLEAENGSLPKTPTVNTGGGGRHYYFCLPVGMVVSNRAGVVPGIDVRGDNGYVVAPPSLHVSGIHYTWQVPPTTPLAEPPDWLLVLLGVRVSEQPSQSQPTDNAGVKLTVQSATDDLVNHPGIGEGQRNAMLCKLIGVHLARGEDSDDIEPLAITWGERCSPALESSETIRTLKSLAKKHQQTSVIVPTISDDELEAMPLPAPPEWPILDDAAYHGLLGDIVETMEPETEADPVGILISTLVVFGNAIGRDAHYPIEGSKHAANLFAVMVGDSSRGRKGTSLGRTLSLFNAADVEWKDECISNGLSSGEGLIWALRDPVEVNEPTKEKGIVTGYQAVLKDHGTSDKRLLVIEPEFAQTLKVLKREGNTLSPVIRQAWDGGVLTVMTKNNFAKASETHVSILGHITLPELEKTLCDTDCFNGFANRILWCLVRRHKLLPDGGNSLDLGPLQNKITEAVMKAKSIEVMSRSAEARQLWHGLYPELTAEKPGLYGAVVGRGEAQTLRLSMLYALLDGTDVIDVAHLRAATAVWRYCETSARIIFTCDEATSDPLEQVLLVKIMESPGINRRGLHRAIGGHIPAKELVKALASLRDKGEACCQSVPTGGRPSECWYPPKPPTLPVALPPSPVVVEGPAVASATADASNQPQTTVPALSLTELFDAVTSISGQLKRDGDRLIVDAPTNDISPEITSALTEHQPTLLAMLPAATNPSTDSTTDYEDIVVEDVDFLTELNEMEH
jgi:hypothetical protein